MAVEFQGIAAHPVEIETEPGGGGLGGRAEVEKGVVERVLRVLGPVDADAIEFGVLTNKVRDERFGVAPDSVGSEAAGVADATLWHRAIRQARFVFVDGAARGDDVVRRDDGLDLKIGFQSGGLRFGEELADDATFAAGEIVRGRRLVGQAFVEREVRNKARRGGGVELPAAPQGTIEQADSARARIDGRLTLAVFGVRRLHHIGRGGDGGDARALFEIPQNLIDPLDLIVFRHHRDAEEARGGRGERGNGEGREQEVAAGQHVITL